MKWEFWNALTTYALQLLSIFYMTISPNIIVMWYNFKERYILTIHKRIVSKKITNNKLRWNIAETHTYIASTEIFVVGVSTGWTDVSPLPLALSAPRAVTLNNKVYLFGKNLLRNTELEGNLRRTWPELHFPGRDLPLLLLRLATGLKDEGEEVQSRGLSPHLRW